MLGLITHLIAGVGGVAVGATITSAIEGIRKNWAVAEVGGIKQGEAQAINKQFEDILKPLGGFLEAAGGQALKAEFLQYANELCLPTESGADYVKVPQLRTISNKSEDDVLGTREAQYEYFDDYYKLKKTTDKYVAQVRVLDNLHTLILNYIDMLKKQPGDKYTKVIQELGKALSNLHENFKLIIAQDRDVALLNKVGKKTNREILIEKIVIHDDKVIKEALAEQRQRSLVESCNQAINNEIRTLGQMADFFMRALDEGASKTDRNLVIAKMEDGKVECRLEGDSFAQSPIGSVVAHHLKNTARFKREEVTDKRNSFNDRFKRGDFEVSVKTPNGVPNNVLPNYMQKGFIKALNEDIVVQSADMERIAKIFNYMNLLIALEEDMRHKVEHYGSEGIISTGEFALRRAMIASIYKMAMDEFKSLTTQHPYFRELLENFSNTDFLSDKKDELVGSVRRERVDKSLAVYLPPGIDSIASDLKQVQVLTGVATEAGKVDSIHEEIVKNVDAKRQEAGPKIEPINLNSDEFLYNMALICAQDKEMETVLIAQLDTAKINIPSQELTAYQEKVEKLNNNLKNLKEIKMRADKIFDRVFRLQEVVEGVNPESFNFSKLDKPESFKTMIDEIDRHMDLLSTYAKNTENTDAHKYIAELSSELLALRNKLVLQKGLHAGFDSSNEMAQLVEARSETARVRKDLEEQIDSKDKLVQGLESQIELQKKAAVAESTLLKSQLQGQQNQNASLEKELEEQKKVQDVQAEQIKTLEAAVKKGDNKNDEIQLKLEETEKFTLRIIEQQNNLINNVIVPGILKLNESINNLRTETSSLANKEGKDELLKHLEKVVNDEIKKMQDLITEIDNGIKAIELPENISEQVRSKYKEVKDSLGDQKRIFDESIKEVNALKKQVESLLQTIDTLKEERQKEIAEQQAKEKILQAQADDLKLETARKDQEIQQMKSAADSAAKALEEKRVLDTKKDTAIKPASKFMKEIIEYAERSYSGSKKLEALRHIRKQLKNDIKDATNDEDIDKVIKKHFDAFLIVCMQKRRNTFFKGTTDTGEKALQLLDNIREYNGLKKHINNAGIAQKLSYKDVANDLANIQPAVTEAKKELHADDLTVSKYMRRP